jgi:hypothetical protein
VSASIFFGFFGENLFSVEGLTLDMNKSDGYMKIQNSNGHGGVFEGGLRK